MAEYRRWWVAGGSYFFTVVVHERRPIFREPEAGRLLGSVMRAVRREMPFTTIAAVVLPDHLHAIWSLPRGDDHFDRRWQQIKAEFSKGWGRSGRDEGERSASRRRHGERGVWQRRFWEHLVRDEDDMERLVDYVHFNPVKHGYVARPGDWPWSSFPRFVRQGHYPADWGRSEPPAPEQAPGE